LIRKERSYEREIAILTARNGELQQRLGSLKTELNFEGHDVDTWLNSCSDIDHSISTQTASEAEMYRTLDDDNKGDDDDDDDDGDVTDDVHQLQHQLDMNSTLQTMKSKTENKCFNGLDDLDTNNNHQGIQSILNHSCEFYAFTIC
jgi:hypothetical protein